MSWRIKHSTFLLGLVVLGYGCSVKQNTTMSRTYHNVTAHYNVYFNAHESYKAGIERINQSVQDDYTRLLPVFKTALPEASKIANSEMEVVLTKCQKLIATHSITQSPPRRSNSSELYKKFASKGEYNEWVDDSYLLMGKANIVQHDYQRALENFNYITRKFSDQLTRFDALLGMARVYIELGDYPKAVDIFSMVERDPRCPPRLYPELSLSRAYYDLKMNDQEQAIVHLNKALQFSWPHVDKLRLNFLMGQLLAAAKRPEEASKQYQHVLHMRPGFAMAFQARIARMELTPGNNQEVLKQLSRMLDNPVNRDFRDRIYFAQATLALKGGDQPQGINLLRKSVQYSTANPKQRAISSLTLARIYFEAREYLAAACYYDTAVVSVDANYPGYAEIVVRASALKRLATELNVIHREDSLQKMAQLPEADRMALINKQIDALKQKEAALAQAASQASANQNFFRSQQFRQQQMGSPGGGGDQSQWYFYNPMTVGIGKSDFQRIWGNRKLEDDWRRKNKSSQGELTAQQPLDSTALQALRPARKKVADPKVVEFYLQDIPLSDSMRQKSNDRIKIALYNAGRLYRSEINDPQRAIEQLEELSRRFKGDVFELPAWFELYQLYQQTGDAARSEQYKQQIIAGYPESKYAMFLQNPNFFAELKSRKEAVEKRYGEALAYYTANQFQKAHEAAEATLKMNPDSLLLPRVKFVALTSQGSEMPKETFSAALDQYIKSYPKATTTPIAQKIKNLIQTNALTDYQQLLAKGYIREQIQNGELSANDRKKDEFGGKYAYDESMFHYFVIAFPKSASIDVNRLIYDLANYNLDYYTSTDFDIEASSLDNRTQLVTVRSFPDKEEGLIYFRSIIRKRGVFQSLKGTEYVNFLASSTNYRTILADKDYLTYIPFFVKNYSTYISAGVPLEELPNPEELLAKVKKEEQQAPQGKFVLVQPTLPKDSLSHKVLPPPPVKVQGPYLDKPSSKWCYTLIYLKKQTAEENILKAVESFNTQNFGGKQIRIDTVPLDPNRGMIVVSGLGEKGAAQSFQRHADSDNGLSTFLKGLNVRVLVISEENLEIFKREKNVVQYQEFFQQLN